VRQKILLHLKMLLFVLLLLWNDKEGARAMQGEQTSCVDVSFFVIVVGYIDRRNRKGGEVILSDNVK
jgi:hypothetical protein